MQTVGVAHGYHPPVAPRRLKMAKLQTSLRDANPKPAQTVGVAHGYRRSVAPRRLRTISMGSGTTGKTGPTPAIPIPQGSQTVAGGGVASRRHLRKTDFPHRIPKGLPPLPNRTHLSLRTPLCDPAGVGIPSFLRPEVGRTPDAPATLWHAVGMLRKNGAPKNFNNLELPTLNEGVKRKV